LLLCEYLVYALFQAFLGRFNRKYNRLVKRYEVATEKLKKSEADRAAKAVRERDLRVFITGIEKRPLAIEEWDGELWMTFLESATVYKDGNILFKFKDGTEIKAGVA